MKQYFEIRDQTASQQKFPNEYDKNELKYLTGSPLLDDIDEEIQALENDFEIIRHEYELDISFEEFVHEINIAKSGPSFPFGDYVPLSNSPNTFEKWDKNGWNLIAKQTIDVNQEIKRPYKNSDLLSNYDLFNQFGIVLDSNQNNYVNVNLRLNISDSFYDQKVELMETDSFNLKLTENVDSKEF